MKERPILFNGPMVRALLDGSKTQTRRVVKPQPDWVNPDASVGNALTVAKIGKRVGMANRICSYGQPGSRLWVRETWAAPHAYDHLPPRMIPQDARIHYAATEDRGGLLWRPSIHMPRWASRITLEVTGVRVERLQEISEADAMAEGVAETAKHLQGLSACLEHCYAYQDLWESINGPGSWDENPWVWVVEFKNIATNQIQPCANG